MLQLSPLKSSLKMYVFHSLWRSLNQSFLKLFESFRIVGNPRMVTCTSNHRPIPTASPAQRPSNEVERLKELHRYNILDTPGEVAFDDLTALASYISGTPMAFVSLVDANRQWFKSKVGLEATETPRELAFCAHAILSPDEPLIVPDTLEDERFATHPLVLSNPSVRFYAGIPLVTPNNFAIGSLCVVDRIPRRLTSRQIEALQAVGRQVITQMELRLAVEKEKELTELKSRIISTISHEYRTPLTSILSSAELLERYSHSWSDEKKLKHTSRIRTSVNHMASMVNDLLFLDKAEANRLKFNPELLNLEQFCRELLEEVLLDNRSHTNITFECRGNCTNACLDKKRLRQILINLLSNAIKYSPAGSTIRFSLERVDDVITMSIQDSGIGIPATDQLALFESFHRASNVGTIPGTGLGLAIVKKCVDSHGGKISVDSSVGRGSKFTVTLPLNSSVTKALAATHVLNITNSLIR